MEKSDRFWEIPTMVLLILVILWAGLISHQVTLNNIGTDICHYFEYTEYRKGNCVTEHTKDGYTVEISVPVDQLLEVEE